MFIAYMLWIAFVGTTDILHWCNQNCIGKTIYVINKNLLYKNEILFDNNILKIAHIPLLRQVDSKVQGWHSTILF